MTVTNRTAALGLAAVVVLAAACGNSGEDSLEQLIERETGEDVNIDFGEDGINVQTDEGSFTVDDDGNFVITGEDGEVITGDIDADGDSVNVQSDDGNISIEGDGETGSVEISGDDGDVSFQSSTEIPPEWPADVPQPTGLDIEVGSAFTDENGTAVTVTGTVGGDLVTYVGEYSAMLEAAGLPQTSNFESDGAATAFHENAMWDVVVSGTPLDDGTNQMSVFVSPQAP